MLSIKRKLVRRIHQNETCSNIRRDNATANNSVVLFTTAVKLPCGLKQLEEFAGGSPMLRIRRNGDHVRSLITVLRSPWVLHSRLERAKLFRFELMDSKAIASRGSEKLTYGIQKLRLFACPGMVEIYPLAALRCLRDFLRI